MNSEFARFKYRHGEFWFDFDAMEQWNEYGEEVFVVGWDGTRLMWKRQTDGEGDLDWNPWRYYTTEEAVDCYGAINDLYKQYRVDKEIDKMLQNLI